MSRYGIEFNTSIFIEDANITNKYQLEIAINEKLLQVQDIEKQISMFAASNPRDIIPNNWNDDPIIWLNNQVHDLLDHYVSTNFELENLKIYKEYIEEGNEFVKPQYD